MRICAAWLASLLLFSAARAEVRVLVQDTNGIAALQYQCAAGEVVRAFALDVSVDSGQIVGISGFFRGESKAGATGYGIFPAAFRDHLAGGSATNLDWNASEYSPLAVVADDPSGTLPGLNSNGVTLEFGGLWDATVPAAVPPPAGTLCLLELSEPAHVSVAANTSRGGVVSAYADSPVQAVFTGTLVGPAVLDVRLANGAITIRFQGGQLQTANTLDGQRTDTGDSSGQHSEPLGANPTRFYRVRRY